MARACRTCPGLALPGSSQCARCGGQTRQSGTENARRRMRAKVNAEGSAVCARCGSRHPARHIRIDHMTPLAAGGRDVRANLQALCTPCHADKSAEDEVARYADMRGMR